MVGGLKSDFFAVFFFRLHRRNRIVALQYHRITIIISSTDLVIRVSRTGAKRNIDQHSYYTQIMFAQLEDRKIQRGLSTADNMR